MAYVAKETMIDVLANCTYASAYWCDTIEVIGKMDKYVPLSLFDGRCREEKMINALFKGYKLKIYDDEGEMYYLTLKNFSHEIAQGKKEYGDDLAEWDGLVCDEVFQKAIFGEVVYG